MVVGDKFYYEFPNRIDPKKGPTRKYFTIMTLGRKWALIQFDDANVISKKWQVEISTGLLYHKEYMVGNKTYKDDR